MGGLLVLPLALRRPQVVRATVLLATPWDFHADGRGQARLIQAVDEPLRGLIELMGVLPTDAIQALFAALDPLLTARKFTGFAALKRGSAAARDFVALEDWLNDGMPLAGAVARDCLFDWYGDNTPGRGLWRIGGEPVRPERLGMPALVVVPGHDRIVPPQSAAALGAAIPGAEVWRPALGHIGMIASPRARTRLWRPLADWLARTGADGAAGAGRRRRA
jgi:polyhydroxyalkanoate synthase